MDERIRTHLATLETSPGNRLAFEALEQHYEDERRWDDLLRLYEARLTRLPDDPEAPALMTRAAQVLHEKLADPARAEGWFRRVLQGEPNSAVALSGLRTILEARGDGVELAALMESQAQGEKSPEALAEAYVAVGRTLEERAGRRDRALFAYRRALEVMPRHREALRRMREGYMALGRLEAARELLDEEAAADPGRAPALVAAYVELGRLASERPTLRALCRSCAEAALALDPSCGPARALLQALEALAKGWRDQARALRSRAVEERDRKVAARLYLQLAELHAAFDPETTAAARAQENIGRAFLLWPGMPGALEVLEKAHASSTDPAPLARALEQLAAQVPDRATGVDVQLRLAALFTVRSGDRIRSLAALEKAFATDPSRGDAATLYVELLVEEGRLEEAAQALERHLSTSLDRGLQVELRLQLADLFTRHLGDVARARAQLEAVLRIDPGSARADERLEPLLDPAADTAALSALIRRKVERARDGKEKLRLLDRLAALLPAAERVSVLARSLLIDPSRPRTRKELEEAATEAGAGDELVRAYRAAADVATEPATEKELLRRAATLLDGQGRPADAAAVLRRIVERDPGDEAASTELEAVLARSGEYAALAADWRARLSASTDPRSRRALLRKLAAHEAAHGGDPAAAVEIDQELLRADPKDVEAQRRLAANLSALGRFEEQIEVLRSLSGAGGTAGLEARAAMGHVLVDQLGRAEEGALILAGVFREAPDTAGVLPLLEKLLASHVEAPELAALLGPHYAAHGDLPRLVETLELRIAAEGQPGQQAPLLLALAEACEGLGDARGAFSALARAFGCTPSDRALRARLEALSSEMGNAAELAELYKAAWGEPTVGAELATRVAELARGTLGDGALYAEALARRVELDPADAGALAGLAEAAEQADALEDAAAWLSRLAQVAPGSRAGAERRRGSCLLRLGRPAEAAAALRVSLEAGAPENLVLPELSEALSAAGESLELERVLARRIELAAKEQDPAVTSRLRSERARLLAASGDGERAGAEWAAILAERPGDPDAVLALEQQLADPRLAPHAARALEPAYQAARDFGKLVSAIEREARAEVDPLARAGQLRRAAHAAARELRDPRKALELLAQALPLSPLDAVLRSELRVVATELSAHDRLAEILSVAAEALPPAQTVALDRELAELYEKRLRDRPAAVARQRRILAGDGADIEALKALHRLLRLEEDWGGLHGCCMRLGEVAAEPHDRLRYLREAGQVAEELMGDLDRAVSAHRRIAEADPFDRQAAMVLDRLLGTLGRHEEQAWALELRRAQARDQADRNPGDSQHALAARELALRLAELRRARMGDVAEPLALLAEVLAEDPRNPGARSALETWARSPAPGAREALAHLDEALARTGEHARRVEMRQARLPEADKAERAALYQQLRELHERALNQPQLAFLDACKAFLDGPEEELELHLERLARLTGSFEELADVYEAAASALLPDDEAALAFRRRAAEVRERELRDAEGAIDAWKRVLQGAPADRAALDALARLYTGQKQGDALAQVYRRNADLADEPTARAGWLLKVGELSASALADDRGAIAAYREALAADPGSLPALEALDRLYSKDRDVHGAELTEVLALLADAHPPASEQRLRTLTRHAVLLLETGHEEASVDVLEALLTEAPDHAPALIELERLLGRPAQAVRAALLLEPHYRASGDEGRLCAVLEIRAAAAAQRSLRRDLLAEIVELRERAGDPAGAFGAAIALCRTAPEEQGGVERLIRLGHAASADTELAGALEEELERRTSGDPAFPAILRELAALHVGPLGRPQAAAAALEKLVRLTPTDTSALFELTRLYRGLGSPRELDAILEKRAELEPDPEKRKDLWFEMANLREEQLGDREAAIAAYRKILEIDETDDAALAMLSRLLGETQRWDDLAVLLEKEATNASARRLTAEARELRFKLGRVKQVRLSDPAAAVELYRSVLAEQPRHPGTLAALEELSRSDDAQRRALAAELLAPIYAAEGDSARAASSIEALAAMAPEPVQRASLQRQLATLYAGPLALPEQALQAAGKALLEVPDDPQNLLLCLEVASNADPGELAALLEQAASSARTEPARVALRREMARLWERALEPARAREEWRRVRAHSPDDAEGLDALTRLSAMLGDVDGLLEVLRARLARAEELPERRDLLFQIAVTQEEKASDPSGALATYRRLLEVAPLDAEALARMDLLCVRTERTTDLADVLSREEQAARERGDTRARVEFLERLALLRETRLLDRDGALALYSEVLALVPNHPGTVARLEAILARDPGAAAAAEALTAVYLSTSNWPRYAAALEARAAAAGTAEERRAILLELADVRQDKQRRPDLAFMALTRAFRESPQDAEVRGRLERAAEAAEALEELAGVFEEQIPRLLDADAAAEIALRLAALLESRMGDFPGAARFYERARDLSPAAARKALPPLERIYRSGQKWQELATVIESLAAGEERAAEKVGLYFRLAQLCTDRLNDPARAGAAYRQILSLEKGHLPSLRALGAILEASKEWSALYDNLLAQREADPASHDRLTARLAELAEQGIGDPERAVSHHREVLARNPRSESSFGALEGLLDRGGRTAELVDVLKARLPHATDPREIVRLHEKLGTLLHALGDTDLAIKSFTAALERDPKNRRALEALRDVYSTRGEVESLASVLRRLVPLQDDAAGVKEVRLWLAETLAGLGRRDEAVETGKRVLDLEPHDALQLAKAEALFRDLLAWPEVIRAMELQAALLDPGRDLEEAVALYGAVARIWGTELKRPEGGAPALEKVLEMRPHDREAFEGLRGIYRSVADWRRYALVSERFVETTLDPVQKVQLYKEVAEVHEKRLGQREIAFAKLGAALELAPHDGALRAELRRLADEGRMHDELAMILENVADAQARGPVAAELYLEMARLVDEKLDDAAAAEQSLRKVLEFDPANSAALEGLSAIFARRGQDRPYVLALEQKLEATASLEEKKSILHEIARVYDERLGDPGEAVYSLRRALELDPGDAVATGQLGALYRRERRFPDLVALISRAREWESDPVRRAELQLQLAEVTEVELGDEEGAVQAYRAALDLDAGSTGALDALERLFTRLDRPSELLWVFDRRIDLTEDAGERARVLFKAAGIWETKLGSVENAIACLEGVLTLGEANLQALKALENLLRQAGKFERLIEVLEEHVRRIEKEPTSRSEVVELLLRMGEVFVEELRRPDRAENAFRRALELDPDSRAGAAGLARVYERTGNWQQALELYRKEARLAGGAREAVEIFHRMGTMQADMMMDPSGARSSFQMALDLDPGHLPTLRALRSVHGAQSDVTGVLEALVQEATFTESPAEKTRLYDEVGRIQLETRQDREAAARYFEEARRHSPEDLPAARALAEIYVAREEWEKAEEVLDVACEALAEEGGADALRELVHKVYRLGFVCERLGKNDKALRSYSNAYEIDPTFLPASEAYAHLLAKAGDHASALKVYQAILIHHRDDLTDPEVVEIHFATGELRRKLGDVEAALKSFSNALDLDAWHVESHRALVELHEAIGDPDSALEHRRKLLEVLDGADKHALLIDTARVATEVLADPYQAIDCLEGALKIEPGDVPVMDQLLGLYLSTRQGPKAAELLERTLAMPELPRERRIKAHVQLGELYQGELREVDDALQKAVHHLDAALELDWREAGAFQSLEAMLATAKDWRSLEQNYVRMLARLPKEEGTKAARILLYRTLGDLYMRALKDPGAALEAYRALNVLAPEDPVAAELYAELLGQKAGSEEEAIAAFHRVLPLSTTPEKAVAQLVVLHARRKELDRAYVAAQVSCFLLGKGGRDEQGIVDRLKRYARDSAVKALPQRMWQEKIFHEKAKGSIGEILQLVQTSAGALFASDHGKLSLQGRDVKIDRKRDKVDVSGSMLFFANAYKQVARTLDLSSVELFKTAGVSGVNLAPTFPVCVVAGEDVFAEQRPKKELYYTLGKQLTFARPEFSLARLMRYDDLLPILEAAVKLGEPRFKNTIATAELEKVMKRLEKALSPAAAESLKKLAFQYTRDPSKPNLKSFLEGAEYTATRVGVLMGSDLSVTWRVAQADLGMTARLKPVERQRDLLLFCLSDAYAELREAIGISVDVPI